MTFLSVVKTEMSQEQNRPRIRILRIISYKKPPLTLFFIKNSRFYSKRKLLNIFFKKIRKYVEKNIECFSPKILEILFFDTSNRWIKKKVRETDPGCQNGFRAKFLHCWHAIFSSKLGRYSKSRIRFGSRNICYRSSVLCYNGSGLVTPRSWTVSLTCFEGRLQRLSDISPRFQKQRKNVLKPFFETFFQRFGNVSCCMGTSLN